MKEHDERVGTDVSYDKLAAAVTKPRGNLRNTYQAVRNQEGAKGQASGPPTHNKKEAHERCRRQSGKSNSSTADNHEIQKEGKNQDSEQSSSE